jgi:hypothetical protein
MWRESEGRVVPPLRSFNHALPFCKELCLPDRRDALSGSTFLPAIWIIPADRGAELRHDHEDQLGCVKFSFGRLENAAGFFQKLLVRERHGIPPPCVPHGSLRQRRATSGRRRGITGGVTRGQGWNSGEDTTDRLVWIHLARLGAAGVRNRVELATVGRRQTLIPVVARQNRDVFQPRKPKIPGEEIRRSRWRKRRDANRLTDVDPAGIHPIARRITLADPLK